MKDGVLSSRQVGLEGSASQAAQESDDAVADEIRQRAARRIAVETKKLWREAQAAGLEDLAQLMEESFYRAYQQAGGPKAMRAV